MKKFTSIFLIFALSVCLCGCEDLAENINSDFVSEAQNLLTEDSNSTVSSDEQKPKQEENTNSQKEKTESKNNTSNTKKEKTESKNNTSNAKKEESKKETVTENKTTVIKSRLPEVKFSPKDSNVRFTDMVNLSNGGFAVSGHLYAETKIESIIQIYDKNATLENQYTYHNENSNGFDKIALCSDGGFIAASQQLTKINSNFETEWSVAYEKNTKFRHVFDIEEINPNCYAVAFASFDDVMKMQLKIVFLDKNGGLVETIGVVNDIFAEGTDIISGGNGDFYLLTSCNKSTADMYPLVAENYDNSKATEAIIMHFSAERELVWAKTLGGGGNDWIEEATIDNNGNIYLAVGTEWYGADSFWEMSVERSMPYRRMLVKLDKNGNIIYRTPLANKGLAVDQVFGIHIKNNNAYVVGMSDYFDGYQVKYPCEQILPNEKGNRVFCVYNACIDGNGKELDRKIFRCDQNNMPCDSALLLNGSLVIAGRVSADENPFNLEFPFGVDAAAALFIYK